jgi:hypothetical protein
MQPKLLYRVTEANGGLVFAPPEIAQDNARLHQAIETSTTWEQFRKAIPPREYSEVVRYAFDLNGLPRPKGSDPFSSEKVPGWTDGDYPPWLQQRMDEFLPEEVLEKFGNRSDTFLNGDFWFLDPADEGGICAMLRSLGWEVERAQELPFT